MKKVFLLFILFAFFSHLSNAQLANWTGYKATKFPTNLSGQIHGQARISQMKFHPSNPNKLYAVTAQGGLFTSNDGGNNWVVSAGSDALAVNNASICIDYTDDQILYLGGGDPNYYGSGAGLYKSVNGGATFNQLSGGLPTNRIIIEIILHPTDHNTIVVATNGGIYKSTDAGLNWTAKTSTSLQFSDMKQSAGVGSLTLFACTNTNTPEFYRSTDFGDTWTLITSGINTPTVANIQAGSRVAVTPADPNVVYFGMVSSGGMIYKSTDNGLTFTEVKAGGSPYLTYYTNSSTDSGQGNYNFCIGVDGADANKIWLQSHNTWYSSNGGATWTMLTHWASKVHTDMHQIGKSPYDNTKLYSCNDGGVWFSTDEGNNWTPKSDGIYAFEIGNNAGKSSPTRRDFVSIGTQDNGELFADSTGWYTNRGGDWYSANVIDKRTNSNMIYYGDNAMRRPAVGSQTTYNLPTASWQDMAFNRTNTNLAFAGSGDIYRSTDVLSASPSWTQISTFNKTIKSVHSCIADPNRLYVLTSDQKIYVSTNALSASPTFNMYALPTASNSTATVTAICNNADIVYISINNKVYRSADGGQTWTNITYNLPSVNHRRILSEEYYGTEELVFVATNNAVYYKKAGQVTWTNYSTNLPARKSPTELSMFDDGTNRALIRYKSYGRGVFETPFENLRPLKALYEASTSNPCNTNVFQFKDLSLGTPVSYSWTFAGGTPATSNIANPVVTFPGVGNYNVTLVVTDAGSNSSTATGTIAITQMSPCNPDTIPGNTLQLLSNSDYAVVPALGIMTNTITMSGWIKPNGAQSSSAGLFFSSSNGATGLNLINGNQLGYHWNDEAGSYNFTGGPVIPMNTWSHVALVVNATSATFYLNGMPYTRTATHNPVNFNQPFQLGRDRTNSGRNFVGMMDEVCFYNRALSTNEIRELMHLTKNYQTTDASLIRYYQFNETTSVVLEHTGTGQHASLVANATRTTSTAPVGGGVFERQSVTTGGLKTFNTPGVELQFPATGTYPNGDLVVTKLNVSPDQKPTPSTVPSNGYWIINNFGTNAIFSPLTSIQFNNLPNISTGYAVGDFGFYKRSSVADGNTWGNVMDQADSFTPNGQNSSIAFSTNNNISSFSQFVLTPTYLTAGEDRIICAGASTTLGSGSNPKFTYLWTPSTGLSSTSIGNPVASPTQSVTYTVLATEISTGTTLTDAVVVSVAPSPLSVSPSTATICPGGSVNLSAVGGDGLPGGTVQIGSGTMVTSGSSNSSTLGPNPLQNWYGGSKQQILFTMDELNSLGMRAGSSISSIAFYLVGVNTAYALNSLQVKAQHTALTTLSSLVTSGWATVRNAASYTPAAGWNTLAFDANFIWNGTSGLLFEINYSNANAGSSGNTSYYDNTTNVSTLFYRVDNATAATVNAYAGAPSFTYNARNNTRFSYTNPSTYTWSPSTGLNTASGANVTASPTSTTTYTVTATTMGCTATASVPIEMQTYGITATAGVGGSISPNGTTTVICGSNQSYTISANSNYAILDVLVDGASQGAISSYTFTNVTAGHSISVTFVSSCVNPTVPTISASTTTNCGSIATTLSIASGTLNSATAWKWYSGSCGTTLIGTGTSMSVTPTSTTTYFVRGEGGCVTPGACADVTVTVNTPQTWYLDADTDGYYTGSSVSACSSPGIGYTMTVTGGGDCNDASSSIHPNSSEVCGNGIDDNCNASIDEGCGGAAPVNDLICNASPMPNPVASNMGFSTYKPFGTKNCNNIIGNTTNATIKGTLPASSCGTNGKGLWYKFTAPICAAGGVVPFAIQISTSNSSTNFDTKVRVFASGDNTCNGALTEIGCDNDGGDPALGCEGGLASSSLYNFTGAVPGNTYFVLVDGNGASASGNFELGFFMDVPAPTLSLNTTSPDKMNISTVVSAPIVYTYYWKPQGSSGYSMDNKTVNTYTTPLLAAGVTYDVQVLHRCATATTQLFHSDIASLAIPSYTNCAAATLSCGISTSNSITVSWNEQTGAYTAGGTLSGYLVYYRPQFTTGYSVWSNPAVTCSGGICSYTISNLTPGVTYEIWVLTRCSATATVKSNTVACSTTALVPMMAANSEENPNDVFTFEHNEIEYHDVKFDELALYGLNLPVPNENVNLNYSIVDGKLVQSSFTGSTLLDSQAFDFVLMPNPTSEQTTVLISAEDLQSKAVISVVDALGRVISTQNIALLTNGSNATLETSHLANGVYNVCVKTAGQVVSKKLIVQH